MTYDLTRQSHCLEVAGHEVVVALETTRLDFDVIQKIVTTGMA